MDRHEARSLERSLRASLTRWFLAASLLGILLLGAELVLVRPLSPGSGPRWIGAPAAALVLLTLVLLALAARRAARRAVTKLLSPLRALGEEARQLSPSNPGGRVHLSTDAVELHCVEEELNSALARMEEAFRSQAHFAGNVAHELRTPIAALMADVQVSRLGERSLEKSYAFLEHAEEELRLLSELLESFLVMAQVEANDSRKDLVYVDDVVRRAIRRCAPLATARGVELVVRFGEASSHDPFVRGDAQLLQAMLENLLRNAIHHSPRGEGVTVSASCSGEAVRIRVEDRGPGIPAALREAVFERGFRASAPERELGGAGLGLAIVRSVARLHGGDVTLDSGASSGCRFVVTLPLAPEASERTADSEY